MEEKIKAFQDILFYLFKEKNLNSHIPIQDQDPNFEGKAYVLYSKAETFLDQIATSNQEKAKILANVIYNIQNKSPALAPEVYLYLVAQQPYNDPTQTQFEDLVEEELQFLSKQNQINKIHSQIPSSNRED